MGVVSVQQPLKCSLYLSRFRLRKKTWKSPGTVYLDYQVIEKDIHVFSNFEMFIEPLEGACVCECSVCGCVSASVCSVVSGRASVWVGMWVCECNHVLSVYN